MRKNGFDVSRKPILKPLQSIEHRDALLNKDGTEAEWPETDVIIGNPPFLGDRKMIRELGEPYVNNLRDTFKKRVPGGADLVCYWFCKAWDYASESDRAASWFGCHEFYPRRAQPRGFEAHCRGAGHLQCME